MLFCLSVCLPAYLRFYPSVCLSACLLVYPLPVSLPDHLSVALRPVTLVAHLLATCLIRLSICPLVITCLYASALSACLPVWLLALLPVHDLCLPILIQRFPFVYVLNYLPVCPPGLLPPRLSVCLWSAYLLVGQSACLPVCSFTYLPCLSVCLSVSPPACLSTCLSVCLSFCVSAYFL